MERLLDPTSIGTMQSSAKDRFLDFVHSHQCPKLVNALDLALVDLKASKFSRRGINDCIYHACELLAFFTQHYPIYIKKIILGYNVLHKLAALVKYTEPLVSCAAIRFLRKIIALKHPQFIQDIVRLKIMDVVVEVFLANGARYNMLNSVVIELMKFIREQNLKQLVEYIVVNHDEKFRHIEYVATFRQLRNTYEETIKNQEPRGTEYQYFEQGNSDSDTDAPSAASSGSERQSESAGTVAVASSSTSANEVSRTSLPVQGRAGVDDNELGNELDEKLLEMSSSRNNKRKQEEMDLISIVSQNVSQKKFRPESNKKPGASQGFLQFSSKTA
jgi:protein phosphatase-4 regulatory subunit 3